MISIIIRAYNEASWLERCLEAIKHQRLDIDDVILVDNESTDGTREIGEAYGVKLTTISRKEFTFGRALNQGIAIARHPLIAILSAHCIPIDELWADYLAVHLQEPGTNICGVYGKQEPLPDTSDVDARDLWTTFRDERQTQTKDFFFHNANSSIRRDLWEAFPFDENIKGVEDRAWTKQMLNEGFSVVYEPNARVYHHHGIHQDRDPVRARRVVESIRYVLETP